ncbi:hypothetical protein RGAI101_1922 [Roseobacter sp. GAI101]|nr:hypothetical protein RGAI101_1922 [Roseobacter sp. GAI101]
MAAFLPEPLFNKARLQYRRLPFDCAKGSFSHHSSRRGDELWPL